MSLEQKECKKITSSNEKGIDKFKVDALLAFFIDKKEKKRDGPGRRKGGTVLGRKKEGRSWEKKERDGPWKKKRGTVLGKKEEGRSWEEKKRDGPGKKKRGTVLGEEKEGRSSEKEKRTSNPKNEKAFSYIKPKSTTKNRAKITIKVNNSSI